jgi:RNA polymerase-binding transcription factor DksA
MNSNTAKATLEKLRLDLLARVTRIQGHVRRDGTPLDQDSEEAAVEKENDAVLDGLDAQGRSELAQIDHALERISRGQYHICTKCGATIAPERLTALPYTTSCKSCA